MQVRPSRASWSGAVLAAALCACGGEGGRLEGSVTSLLDLRYDRAEAQLAEGELSVSFLTQQGTGTNTVLKVSAQVEDMLPEGYTGYLDVDLAEVLANGAQRGAVGRNVLDEPARTFPALRVGGLEVKALPSQQGQRISGEFHVTFVNGTHPYSGRTIFGSFEATVP
ncbi:hypothetical protein [Myxococcus sp. Y35]|uniref:hypothetical protein n=1 Tax=Pseudomyxococcus flavus TaxID=3115648 RepID=UPI003CEA5556